MSLCESQEPYMSSQSGCRNENTDGLSTLIDLLCSDSCDPLENKLKDTSIQSDTLWQSTILQNTLKDALQMLPQWIILLPVFIEK